MSLLKTERWRSKKYLDWVRDQDCIMCGHPGPVEPHHIKHLGGFSGTALKAPDSLAMPLCGYFQRNCHNTMHSTEALWPKQWEYIARTLEKAIREGVLKVA